MSSAGGRSPSGWADATGPCSRWLAYPRAHTATAADVRGELAAARVATLVYWSPGPPYRSSLDGTTCAELAAAYQEATGAPWLQPLGLPHALLETAHQPLSVTADPNPERRPAAPGGWPVAARPGRPAPGRGQQRRAAGRAGHRGPDDGALSAGGVRGCSVRRGPPR
ncbi:hypothetical protein AB0K80_32730 [Streptomyces sp. NPDC052682]|uniref:hypothetical protein n=1 Tax=Streptomyces sp. NPDC052682 TaxID=3154954 RepID=UPI0034145F55